MQEVSVYRLNVGSCNGCDIEVLGALAHRFKLSDLSVKVVGEPENANVLLVVGVVSAKMKEHLKQVYEKIKPPKIVVAAGSCALSRGVFDGSYNIPTLVDEVIPVNAYVPGCPPSPHAIVDAIAGVVHAKLLGWRAPEGFRGVPEVNSERCTGCGACAEVCPAKAIEITDKGDERTVRFNHAKCIFCATCEEVCPEDAIEMAARYNVVAKNKAEAMSEAKLKLASCVSCGALFVSPKHIQNIIERILEDVSEYMDLRDSIRKSMMLCKNCRTLIENARSAKGLLFKLENKATETAGSKS
jgi:Ni,Fe-hydrogenase III small subunit/NAD-dependent dihydropyrimidine dehydrogenase PreA subunit